MATQPALAEAHATRLALEPVASFKNLRALAWNQTVLYASRGYSLLAAQADLPKLAWAVVGDFGPAWWRSLTSHNRLSSRLVRDGFHALAIHPNGNLVAAVPGAIITLRSGEHEFRVTHRIQRGTRPLHITVTPDGTLYWGEYFDNPERNEVHIYASSDAGLHWNVAYTFEKGSIRHVHNVVYDRWERCLWIFTGDYGDECRILRASPDLKNVEAILEGNQQARAVAAIVSEDGLYFASDTPLEQNFIYHLNRTGRIEKHHAIPSSSIYACQNRRGMFFSTMVEPSDANPTADAALFGSSDGSEWSLLGSWRKDRWPMKFFQYGNTFLPDGENTTDLLAATTIAVKNADLVTTIRRTTNI